MKKIYLVVLDSVGIGAAEDAKDFGDCDANTLGNISKNYGLFLPNLQKLGLGNINSIPTIKPVTKPLAYYTHMKPTAKGKDSIAGHWEMMGCIIDKPFNVYTKNGFPHDLINKISQYTGRKIIGNKEASGIKIINELAMKQKDTGALIIYTSVDSTLQVAGHEQWIGIDNLYNACKFARKITLNNESWNVARVIARPFIGEKGSFVRTGNRHDYALDPFSKTALEYISDKNYDVIGIGKINDLFNGKGITKSIPTSNNEDGIKKFLNVMKNEKFNGLVFLNLVDFDSIYGHPRDPLGYKKALIHFDNYLPEIIGNLGNEDILIITADHGNDPTYKGNDHTRENVPLLIYSKSFINPTRIEPRKQFSDLGTTIADILGIKFVVGESFIDKLR